MVALLLVVVVAGGYAAYGASVAGSRLSQADRAIRQVQTIDFTSLLSQTSGGFKLISSPTVATRYQSSVTTFSSTVNTALGAIPVQESNLHIAQARLGDSAWLTVLSRSSLDRDSTRIDHALAALATARSIAGDFQKDGQFFAAYATLVVDFAGYLDAAVNHDSVNVLAKVAALKPDIDATTPLDSAPGLPQGVHGYLLAFQTLIYDLDNLLKNPPATTAALNAIEAKLVNEIGAVKAYNTSGLDSSIQSYYQPMISSYGQELQLASS